MSVKRGVYAVVSLTTMVVIGMGVYMILDPNVDKETRDNASMVTAMLCLISSKFAYHFAPFRLGGNGGSKTGTFSTSSSTSSTEETTNDDSSTNDVATPDKKKD